MNAESNQSQPPWTVLRLVNWTREYFERQGVEASRLATEMLLAHVLKCQRLALYTQFDRVPGEPQLAEFRELVKRAAGGEPIAYLVGHREFYSLDLLVTPDVLIPRPETEVLAERAIDFLRGRENATCWDACTGSGAVAAAIAKNVPHVRVLATDISPAALEVAKKNMARLAIEDRVLTDQADLLTLPPQGAALAPFDAVTANPPYIALTQKDELPPSVLREPHQALFGGSDGLDFIRPILQQAPAALKPGGLLAMEIGFGQAEAVWELLKQAPEYERPEFARDSAGIERVLVAYRK
jgi:release factor glutamine methyltransferase